MKKFTLMNMTLMAGKNCIVTAVIFATKEGRSHAPGLTGMQICTSVQANEIPMATFGFFVSISVNVVCLPQAARGF